MTLQLPPGSSGQKRKILILTADAGFGHRSAANAAGDALKDKYGDQCEVLIVNPLEDRRTPFFLRDSQADYDKMVRNMPELYRFGYDASDASVPVAIVEQALTVLLFEVIRDVLRSHRPDVILSTYPLYQAPVRAVMTIARISIPLIVTITDLATVHRLWFNSSVDQLLVPNDIVRDLALNYGLTTDQVMVTGIPVNPVVVQEKREPREIREALGWQPEIITVLAVGSRRVDRLIDTVNVLNHFGRPFQIVVVAGNDAALYSELSGMEWHVPVHLYDYVKNVPLLMKAADFVVCKAGGLVITESLACARPMMLIDMIPGQETGNADYVVQNEAGDLVRDPIEVLTALSHWFQDQGSLFHARTENARRLGRPQAAYDVATAVWQAAESSQARSTQAAQQGTGRLRLADLLSRNQVRWEDETTVSGE